MFDLKHFLSLICFVLVVNLTNAMVRPQDTIPVISFRVIDAVSGTPVEMAHIINLTQRDGTIADMLGYFKLKVRIGDTITVASLGYFSQKIFNWGQFKKDSTYNTIKLQPRSYHLKELKFTWFSTYDKFVRGITDLKLPETKEELQLNKINEYFNRTIRKMALLNLPQQTSGFSFGKDWLAKQNEKLEERLERERLRRQIERKYSAGIVSALTGLKGNEIFWFMEYCAFTDDYLLTATDYDIRQAVLEKFKIYNPSKKSDDLGTKPQESK